MLTCQKHLFSLPEELHYLNCAYQAPLSKDVEAAGLAGVRRKRNPAAIGAEDFFRDGEEVRALFARLIGAPDPQRIAIIPAASYGIATAARNVAVGRGQNLVVVGDQFPSNVYTWRRLADERGATLRIVGPPEAGPGRARRWNERLLEAIDPDTAVVALGHVHWTDGTRFDLEAVGARARDVDAALIIDGTQSVGALPFDVGAIQPDAVVCAAYKWLLGPYSIGAAYYGPRFDGGVPIEENWITRKDSEHFSRLVHYQDEYQPGAVRYDMGGRSNFILLPMFIAALEHLHAWGVSEIQAYCRALAADFLEDVAARGFTAEDSAWRCAHLFGLRVPDGTDVEALRDALDARNVSVSVRGTSLRIAPHVYNDHDDLAALRDALLSL